MKYRKKEDLINTKNKNWQNNSQKMCIFAIEKYII